MIKFLVSKDISLTKRRQDRNPAARSDVFHSEKWSEPYHAWVEKKWRKPGESQCGLSDWIESMDFIDFFDNLL